MHIESAGIRAVRGNDEKLRARIVGSVGMILSLELLSEKTLFVFRRPGNASQFLRPCVRVNAIKKFAIAVLGVAKSDRIGTHLQSLRARRENSLQRNAEIQSQEWHHVVVRLTAADRRGSLRT